MTAAGLRNKPDAGRLTARTSDCSGPGMISKVQSAPGSVAPVVIAGLSDLSGRYDVLLCDLWGVMHDGHRASARAVDATRRFRAHGGTVIFITNSPRPCDDVAKQIRDLGVPPDAYDGIVTSGDVTIAAIIAAGNRRFYHIGPPRDLALFEAVHRQAGWRPDLTPLEAAEWVVVTGLFDDGTETPADYAGALATMQRLELAMICANPDIVVHVGERLIYCGGALAEAYRAVGGQTILVGKPHSPIYEAALALAARMAGRPVARARVLAVGDGLATDVAGAANEGLDIVFVTSGIHRGDFHSDGAAVPTPLSYAERLSTLDERPFAALPHLAW